MFLESFVLVYGAIINSVGDVSAEVGEPLLLTSLIEQGRYEEAQNLSRVSPDIGNITSFSGFFTVNVSCESNLFFWFMPAQRNDWEKAPILFWQQGGPGSSSFFGLFEELGPFQHFNTSGLTKRKYSWNKENNLLIIDNPAGVGFSYSEKCSPPNGTVIAEELYSALVQFFKLFPQLRNNSFIMSGESYAGHYIPVCAQIIHKNNPSADVKLNLTGLLLSSAWCDPISQIEYGNYYYQLSLIDDWQREIYENYQSQCKESIKVKNWDYAVYNCNILTGTLYDTFMGDVNIYNLLPDTGIENQNWEEFIQTDEIRRSFHVGSRFYQTYSDEVLNALNSEIFQSVKPVIQELLEHYPIVFINGQLDLICPYPLEINFLRSLRWSKYTEYLNANRSQWCFNEDVVGYYKGEHHLYEVLVRGSGHYIAQDKPQLGYQFINSVTSGFPGDPLHALQNCDDI